MGYHVCEDFSPETSGRGMSADGIGTWDIHHYENLSKETSTVERQSIELGLGTFVSVWTSWFRKTDFFDCDLWDRDYVVLGGTEIRCSIGRAKRWLLAS